MKQIKLIIWDLDETFWKGTLSEEGIELIPENIEIVKELVNRGIMNSIASKNDYETAKKELELHKIWDYFIFPKIAWAPKGTMVKNIIKEAQLRPENILFIDDNHMNLEEVSYTNPGINIQTPDFIQKILKHPAFKGKNDTEHSRLKQYKVLEKKHEAEKEFDSNIDFLRQSELIVTIIKKPISHLERLSELILRTNQLNYTKKRIDKDSLLELLNEQQIDSGAIHVKDKYGDYGITGFYALNKEKKELVHFLFSCRILNLGVDQLIYSYLKFPKLNIVGEVQGTLSQTEKPDWIKLQIIEDKNSEESGNKIITTEKSPKALQTIQAIKTPNKNNSNKITILIKGGCDLEQMNHFIAGKNIEIIAETNYVTKDNINIHREHTSILKQIIELDQDTKRELISFFPFLDENTYETMIYTPELYDILVYSVLMDFTQDIYQKKSNPYIKIPFGGFNNIDITNPQKASDIFHKQNISKLNTNFFSRFNENYINTGQINEADFVNNLEFIINRVNKPIIFINAAEFFNPEFDKKERGYLERNKKMNSILDEFISKHENCYLLDIRKLVKSEQDCTNNIRHYKPKIYRKMADELINLIEHITTKEIKKDKKKILVKSILVYGKDKINKLKSKIKKN